MCSAYFGAEKPVADVEATVHFMLSPKLVSGLEANKQQREQRGCSEVERDSYDQLEGQQEYTSATTSARAKEDVYFRFEGEHLIHTPSRTILASKFEFWLDRPASASRGFCVVVRMSPRAYQKIPRLLEVLRGRREKACQRVTRDLLDGLGNTALTSGLVKRQELQTAMQRTDRQDMAFIMQTVPGNDRGDVYYEALPTLLQVLRRESINNSVLEVDKEAIREELSRTVIEVYVTRICSLEIFLLTLSLWF
ncbi:hypothetical protein, conserved [Eimeria necatrix]|uniref:Uncharacterized protein n=1 Tax=Eimeria necatrix TaxID=51315 RepID=U6MYK9_9EIME|nr:hypothetical protein, conserved [Eimeria necatrix]CDJ66795.1 hypothetical protein, conserved [Eimeria necatrix]